MILAWCSSVQLLWVPGHKGVKSNEIADQSARRGSIYSFIGPEAVCIMSESCKTGHQILGVLRAPGLLAGHSRTGIQRTASLSSLLKGLLNS
jgi:hypothetical protein